MKADVNGIELAYEMLGLTGYPLLLFHGFALDRTIWLEMAKALPLGEFLPLSGAGHMPMKENQAILGEGFNRLVERVKNFQ